MVSHILVDSRFRGIWAGFWQTFEAYPYQRIRYVECVGTWINQEIRRFVICPELEAELEVFWHVHSMVKLSDTQPTTSN